MGKKILAWLLLASCPPALFFLGFFAAFFINLLMYGNEEFSGNAGAGFAVLLEGIFLGTLLGCAGIVLAVVLRKHDPWFKA
jgi:hypothetical protein